jgi:exodeoxyribonuclease VII large subunit
MSEESIFTVSQVSSYLKNLLIRDRLLQNINIIGEISNFKLHKPSGHIYFTLKDRQSIIRCVFFSGKNKNLKFSPAEGMMVVARGNISLYERSGYYQLYVEELKPEGIGTLYLAFEQLKEKLQKEGLFDEKNKKPLPLIPRYVGLVTSPTGAAIKDFLTTLKRRFPCVQVIFFPVAVQGVEAAPRIIEALCRLDALNMLDVIVLTRGGGSLEELWPFNEEALARVIFAMNTPLVNAVGHETDFTIADFVADRRASTPTAAAQLIVPEKSELIHRLEMQENRLRNRMYSRLKEKNMALDNLVRAALQQYPRDIINQGQQRIDEQWQRLMRIIAYNIKLKGAEIRSYEEKLSALSPLKIMGRGYTFVVDENNRVLNNTSRLREDQDIRVVFYDGEANCRVREIIRKIPFDNQLDR